MIDSNKYLYWLNSDDSKLGDEIVWREMYSRIGHIFHIIQMIEYNIANILSIEDFEKEYNKVFTENDVGILKEKINNKFIELSTSTFGELKNKVQDSVYLNKIDIAKLEKMVLYRNYLAHQCFKEKLLNNKLSSLENVDIFIDELNDYEVNISEMNDYLLDVFKNNKVKTILMYKSYMA